MVLGARIAQLRKARNITQVQLAKTLGVSLEELMAEGAHAPRKRGPVSRVQQYPERISQLPKARQRAVMDVLDALLAQKGH